MYAAKDRATIACEIYEPPAVVGGLVGDPVLLLSNRMMTPLYPLGDDVERYSFESGRRIRQTYIFADDDVDWQFVDAIDAGMTLKETESGAEHIIRTAEAWVGFRNGHKFMRLFVETVRVDSGQVAPPPPPPIAPPPLPK